jgi:L-lactate dehydrogenase complex protein LldF
MRFWRNHEFEREISSAAIRNGLAFWAFFATRPRLYGLATSLAALALGFVGVFRGRFRWLPLARSWTETRDFPAPQGLTFRAQWKMRTKRKA